DVALRVSRELSRALAAEGVAWSTLTRDADVEMALRERAELADALDAAALLSIHVNSYPPRPEASGPLVCYGTAADLALARCIIARLTGDLGLKPGSGTDGTGLTHKPGLDVLEFCAKPAVLVELGFATNPADAARLSDVGWQRLAAQAIARGVADWGRMRVEAGA